MNSTRQLVTLRQVDKISPIEGADRIVLASVDGWNCIVKKGEFEEGDYGIFIEIDSMLPLDNPVFSFLAGRNEREVKGRKYVRIKSMKMKGVLSQGLFLPIWDEMLRLVISLVSDSKLDSINARLGDVLNPLMGLDARYGVIKYELPDTVTMKGALPAGDFPWFISKTDEPRIQNVFKDLSKGNLDKEYIPTLKLDGSSLTVAYVTDEKLFMDKLEVDSDGGQTIVCSRNLTLKPDDESAFWKGAKNSGILDAVKDFVKATGRQIAVQSELVGPGIQKNHENHDDYAAYAFKIYDIDKQKYLPMEEFVSICKEYIIPMTIRYAPIRLGDFKTVDDFLAYAENVGSVLSDCPEGVVFHERYDDGTNLRSFKAISNSFLLKKGE